MQTSCYWLITIFSSNFALAFTFKIWTSIVGGDPGPIGQNPQFKKPLAGAPSTQSSKATPISMLQELCQKLNKTPRYDLLTMEGRAHQPSFVFRFEIDCYYRGGGGYKVQQVGVFWCGKWVAIRSNNFQIFPKVGGYKVSGGFCARPYNHPPVSFSYLNVA